MKKGDRVMKKINKSAMPRENRTMKWLLGGVKVIAGTAAVLLGIGGLDAMLEVLSRHLNVCGGIMLVMAIAGFCVYRDTKQSLDEKEGAFTLPPRVYMVQSMPSAAHRSKAASRRQMPASYPHSRRSRAS